MLLAATFLGRRALTGLDFFVARGPVPRELHRQEVAF